MSVGFPYLGIGSPKSGSTCCPQLTQTSLAALKATISYSRAVLNQKSLWYVRQLIVRKINIPLKTKKDSSLLSTTIRLPTAGIFLDS